MKIFETHRQPAVSSVLVSPYFNGPANIEINHELLHKFGSRSLHFPRRRPPAPPVAQLDLQPGPGVLLAVARLEAGPGVPVGHGGL